MIRTHKRRYTGRDMIVALVITGLLLLVSYETAFLLLLKLPSPAAGFDSSREIQAACNYLVSNYNSTIGLVAETPAHQKYWLYSDNFLVSIALSEDCGYSQTVETIISNITGILAGYQFLNQYNVLEYGAHQFNAAANYHISGPVWTTVNNQSGTLSPADYADIGFLQAYYFAVREGDQNQASNLFDQTTAMYNGTGFIDKPFQNQTQFQTYKLALYIYVARILNRPIQLNALVTLGRMQDLKGGFYTGYVSDYSTNGTSTNTETTCLAILALHSIET